MKKVFYSEILNKYFDDETECRKAELTYQIEKEAQKKKELATKTEANSVSKEKKELAKVIEEADTALNAAYEDLAIAKEKVKKILEDSNAEAIKVLEPAKVAVREAQRKKLEAVANFNRKYGPYTTVYTGDKALRELERSNDWVNDFIEALFGSASSFGK